MLLPPREVRVHLGNPLLILVLKSNEPLILVQVVLYDSGAQLLFGDARHMEHLVLDPDLKIVNVGVLVVWVLSAIFHHTRELANLLILFDDESVDGVFFCEFDVVLWRWFEQFVDINRSDCSC